MGFRPFYVQEEDERSVLWPLSGWDEDGGWALTAYWRNGRGFGAFTLFHLSEDGTDSWDFNYVFSVWWCGEDWGVFPLVGVGNDDWRFLNFYYENTDIRAHWNFWPILYRKSNVEKDTVDWRLLYGLLGGYEDNKDETEAWLFPFYYYSNDDNGFGGFDNEFYALCYLFGVENSYQNYNKTYHFKNYFFPFYSYESRTKYDENGVPEDEPYNSEFMIPLVYGFDTSLTSGAKEKNREHWALLNLFNFRERNYAAIPRMRESPAQSLLRDSCDRYVNTFWETRTFRVWKDGALTPREQKIVEYGNGECYYGVHSRSPLMIKRTDGSDRDCYFRFDFDKEIFGENGEKYPDNWQELSFEQRNAYLDECNEKRIAFYRRELLKILRAKGIAVADDADKDAMLAAVQKLIEENTEILTEKEFQV